AGQVNVRHPPGVQLQMGTLGDQRVQAALGAPGEVAAQVRFGESRGTRELTRPERQFLRVRTAYWSRATSSASGPTMMAWTWAAHGQDRPAPCQPSRSPWKATPGTTTPTPKPSPSIQSAHSTARSHCRI